MIAALVDTLTGALGSQPFLSAMKFVHIAAISIWIGGLIGLPWLLAQRGRVDRKDRRAVHRLHSIIRRLLLGYVSPAAVVAIGTGTVLIFLRETYDVWFTVKLFFVCLLVLAHHLIHSTQTRLFADDPIEEDIDEKEIGDRLRRLTPLRGGIIVTLLLAGTAGVLLMVLGKPVIGLGGLAPGLMRPGGLMELFVEDAPTASGQPNAEAVPDQSSGTIRPMP